MPTPNNPTVGWQPDLLADTKIPYNPIQKMVDMAERVDHLERFYGVIPVHGSLDKLTADDHPQYALSVSATNRSAAKSLSLASPDDKFNITFDAHGTNAKGRLQVVGQGTGLNIPNANVVALDVAGSSNDRVRFCLGNTNTVPNGSRSVSFNLWSYNTAGTAKQTRFEIVTDAEANGTNSLAVWDSVVSGYRLYLGPTGNFGIGVTQPSDRLQVWGGISLGVNSTASGPGLQLLTGGTVSTIKQLEQGGALSIQSATNAYIQFSIGGSEMFRFHYDGTMWFSSANANAASATAGSATLPANPRGFLVVSVLGTRVKIPYYNV
jgi:hypothetical protein